MANATASLVTVVNTAMVVSGTVTGQILVGMTVTGAGVPAGVTVITAAAGGGAGSYTVTASAANVSIAEPMVFSLASIASFISSSSSPQVADYTAKALVGFGLVFGAVGLSTNTAQGTEYHFGTHQQAIYESQFKGAIFPASPGHTPTNEVRTVIAAPQAYDFTLPAVLAAPLVQQSVGISAEYQFGTHQVQIANSQIQARVFASIPSATAVAPIKTIIVNGQELTRDLTLQPFLPFVPVSSGWLLTMVTAGPQLADLTQQASIQKAIIYSVNAPWNPTTIRSAAQENPWQSPPQIFKPPTLLVKPQQQPFISAAPTDLLQSFAQSIQPKIFPASTIPPKPSHMVQPVFAVVFEQIYQNIYQQILSSPLVLGPPPPPPYTGFRVQATTAGWYNGRFRTPGDVFDLLTASDFANAAINYQGGPYLLDQSGQPLLDQNGQPMAAQTAGSSNTSGYGWMIQVPQSTPIFDWLQANNSPYLPPQDPLRRFIY